MTKDLQKTTFSYGEGMTAHAIVPMTRMRGNSSPATNHRILDRSEFFHSDWFIPFLAQKLDEIFHGDQELFGLLERLGAEVLRIFKQPFGSFPVLGRLLSRSRLKRTANLKGSCDTCIAQCSFDYQLGELLFRALVDEL